MAILQAQLPNYIDFPQWMADGTYSWMPANAPITPANGVAADIYREKLAINNDPAQDIGVAYNKRAEQIIIQNNSAFPLKVRVAHNDDAVVAGVYNFILAGSVVAEDGTGGTYIFFPRLQGIKRISVMSVGGAGNIALTKVIAAKDIAN